MSSADRRETMVVSAYWLHTWPRQYGFALVAVTAAALVRYGLDVALGFTHPFLLFSPTIMLIALLGGFGPGVFATLLSAVIAAYLFMEPLNSFVVRHPRDIVGLVLFGVIGVAISGMGDLFRRRAKRLQEFEKAVEGLEEMIVVVDRGYRYVIANRAFLNYRGMKKEELLGRRIPEILNSGVFETTIKEKLDECFQGKIVRYEMRYTYPSRGERDLFVSYSPIEGPGGIDRVACVLQDITERKRANEALEESESRFRAVYERSPVGIALVDAGSGRFLEVNPKFCEILGRTEEEMLQLDFQSVTHPDDVAKSVSKRKELFEGRSAHFELEKRYLRRDGGEVWANVSVAPMWREQEPQKVYLVMAQDISEHKRAEAAVRRSEQRYRLLFEKNVAGVAIANVDGEVLDCNDGWARILGYNRAEEVRGRRATDFYFNIADREPLLGELKRTGAFFSREMQLRRKDGTPVWVLFNSALLPGGDDGALLVQATAIDITKHKMAEEVVRESEARLNEAQHNARIGSWHYLPGGPFRLSDEMYELYKLPREVSPTYEVMLSALHPEDRSDAFQRALESGASEFQHDHRVVWPDGQIRNMFALGKIRRDPEGRVIEVVGTAQDVTEQVRLEEARNEAEKALQASETHFRLLVEQASDGIFIADAQGKYIDVNSAGAEMLGYTREEMLQLSIPDIVEAEESPRIAPEVARFAGGAIALSEWKFRRKDGSVFPGEVCGKQLPDGRLQGILRDISERRQAEEAMRRNEERFRVALKDSPITVFNQDCELRYTWIYNPQLYWRYEAIGRTDEEIIGPKKAARLVELKRRVLKTGVAVRKEVAIPHDGRSYAFDITVEPLFDEAGKVIGITGASTDIAQLREMTDRLQDARDKLAQEKSYLEGEIQAELGFEEIIGQSPALLEVLKNVRVVAPTDSTVLLLGETGTGKELVARSVHALSLRRDKTFIKLNCAAVPAGLLESELFGHEKGAFTGAVSQKVGRIELADKGTLFLDEIGELPLELQPKLLRVLQDREFERLGGVHTLRVDVRIISATNRDLHQDIANRKFREDLFYRLNVFPIGLPALRQRRTDIPILVHHFVSKHSARMGKHLEIIPDETMTVLQNWNWPGNIRELENMIERMVILSKGRVLAAPPVELDAPQEITDDNLTEMERDHILRVLRETNGVLSGADGAASRLGIKRTTLQSMLKRFGIELQDYRRGSGTFGPS
jgi:formate hydrogenlyase transcriptional activator